MDLGDICAAIAIVLIILVIIVAILAVIAGAIIFVFWAAGTGLKLAGFACAGLMI